MKLYGEWEFSLGWKGGGGLEMEMQDTIEYIPEHPGFFFFSHAGRVSPRAATVHTLYVLRTYKVTMATVAASFLSMVLGDN